MTNEHNHLKKLYYKLPVVLLGFKDNKFEYNFTLNGSSFFLGDIVMIAMDEYEYALNKIKEANCFTINVPSDVLLKELFKKLECSEIIGSMDEFGIFNILNCVRSERIDAPMVKNCFINIECEVFDILNVIDASKNEKIILGKIKKRILNEASTSRMIFDDDYSMTFYKYLTHIKWT